MGVTRIPRTVAAPGVAVITVAVSAPPALSLALPRSAAAAPESDEKHKSPSSSSSSSSSSTSSSSSGSSSDAEVPERSSRPPPLGVMRIPRKVNPASVTPPVNAKPAVPSASFTLRFAESKVPVETDVRSFFKRKICVNLFEWFCRKLQIRAR